MSRIKSKWVVITGASSGIGRACAHKCAGYGANLILVARRLDRLNALKSEIESEYGSTILVHQLDVRDREAVQAFGDELVHNDITPDVLINNAGLASGLDKLHEGDPEDWDRMIDTNVKGLLNVSRVILPRMVKKNAGHVVNIGSIAGYQVYPNGNVYNASKFAVRALTEGMNVDLLGTRIRVSSVSPGLVETEFSQVRFHGDNERAENVYKGLEPLTGEDIADAVLYIINAPEHVNILDLIILPTAQRNAYCVHRDNL